MVQECETKIIKEQEYSTAFIMNFTAFQNFTSDVW